MNDAPDENVSIFGVRNRAPKSGLHCIRGVILFYRGRLWAPISDYHVPRFVVQTLAGKMWHPIFSHQCEGRVVTITFSTIHRHA